MQYPSGMPKAEIVSKSAKETQAVAQFLVQELAKSNFTRKGATVVALDGNLGSGKTTFSQGLARALGIKEKVLSPTFVLVKIYNIYSSSLSRRHRKDSSRFRSNRKTPGFNRLIHVDCYRLKSSKDLLHLGFKNFLRDKDAIIVIEWASRIRKLLPRGAVWIKFEHTEKARERFIKISNL
jgi:tRNA threonylcarbamoyladenosine biosynthesis protein TsaE